MKDEFLSHADAAQLNRNIVLHYIKQHGPVSRTDIWEAMRISRASVTQVIRQLQENDLILDSGEPQVNVEHLKTGRVPRLLRINEDARKMYIFDWNTRRICLTNLGGTILDSIQLDFPAKCIPTVFASMVLEGVEALAKRVDVDPDCLLGLGICLPGLIDSRGRRVLYSVELGWRNVDVKCLFQKRFGENVFLERTGNIIALGEYEFGRGKSYHHVLLVLLEEEGIGASVVVHKDCQHGSNYMFGELGHIKLQSDVLCSCGQRGCLEAVVREHMTNNGGVFDDKVMEYIAIGVSTAVNLCDPGIVLLSGKLLRNLDSEREEKLISCIRSKITNEESRALSIILCKNEEMMTVKGMSAYIFNCVFSVE